MKNFITSISKYRFQLLSIFFLLVALKSASQTNNWLGTSNTNWHTATNWSLNSVPTAAHTVEISSAPMNQPTISTSVVAKSVNIQNGASLTISATGTLTNGTFFSNSGTVQNNGNMVFGSVASVGANAIINGNAFNNNSGATITINRVTDFAIINITNSTLTNSGTINLGSIASTSIGGGINNGGSFTNSNIINMDRCTAFGIYIGPETNPNVVFTNNGTMNIGKNAASGTDGIVNYKTIINNGTLNIDRITRSGIDNILDGIITNSGSINIGSISGGMISGIGNQGSVFTNESTGNILINNASQFGLDNTFANFTNDGTVTIQSTNPLFTEGLSNGAGGVLENKKCAKILVFNGVHQNTGTVNNVGLIQIANGFRNNGTYLNDGILAYGELITGNTPFTNNDIIVGPISVCGSTSNSVLQIGGANSFTIANNWYSEAAQTTISGNYNSGTNTFTRTLPLPFTGLNYLTITDIINNCSRVVPIKLNQVASPTLSPTITQPTTCNGLGKIVFTTTNIPNGTYGLNFDFNGTQQTQLPYTVNNNLFTFDNLIPGTYSNFSMVISALCIATLSTDQLIKTPTYTLTGGNITSPATCDGNTGSIIFSSTNIPNGTYNLNYKRQEDGAMLISSITVSNNAFLLSGLTPGSYYDFYLIINSCVVSYSTTKVVTNPSLTLTAGNKNNPSTCNGTNGIIPFTTTKIANGTYSLNFSKDGIVQTARSITISNNGFNFHNLTAGSYSDFSILVSSCTASLQTAQVLTDPTISLAVGLLTKPTFCGGNTGSIRFTTTFVANGTYNLNYSLAGTPQTPKSITVSNNAFTLGSLTAGSYSDFSLSFGTCSASFAAAQVLEDPTITLTAGLLTNPAVCGGNTGSIRFNTTFVANGTYNLNFSKDGIPQTPKSISVGSNVFTLGTLTAGSYSDFSLSYGTCSASFADAQVLLDPAISLTAGLLTNPTACGANTGSIRFTTVALANGNYNLNYNKEGTPHPPKSITVSNNVFTLGTLTAGSYSNFSLSFGNCAANFAAAQVLTDPAIALSVGAITHPTTCNGTNGIIPFTTTNIPNGTYLLNYKKNDIAQTARTITVNSNAFLLNSLGAGSYTEFSISNNSSLCAVTNNNLITLNEPVQTIMPNTLTNITTCNGTNGSIAFTTTNVSNGNYTLSFTKNDVAQTPQSISVSSNAFTLGTLSIGIYSNFSMVAGGCTVGNSSPQQLTGPLPNTVSEASDTPYLCMNTALKESITHTTTGSTWTSNITGLPTGVVATWADNKISITGTPTQAGVFNYSITLTDGCGDKIATGTITVGNCCNTITGSILETNSVITTVGGQPLSQSISAYVSLVSVNTGNIISTIDVSSGTFQLPTENGAFKLVFHTTPTGSTIPALPQGYKAFVAEGLVGSPLSLSPANGILDTAFENCISSIITNNGRVAFDVNIAFILSTQTALPLELTHFSGKAQTTGNFLEWSTSSEKNFSHFEIERSTKSSLFQKIAFLKGGSEKYNYTDNYPTDNYYYRLKMVDIDGTSRYSKIIYLFKSENKEKASLYPNPAADKLYLSLNNGNKTSRVSIVDIYGRLIINNIALGQNHEIDIRQITTNGIYFVKLDNGQMLRFLVNK